MRRLRAGATSGLQILQQLIDSLVALHQVESLVDGLRSELRRCGAHRFTVMHFAAHPIERRRVLIRSDGHPGLGSLMDSAGAAMLRDQQIAFRACLGQFVLQFAIRTAK